MKTVVKRAIRNEKGYVLITVLILLVVGGLILTPLLGLMSTGLLAGKVYEKKMDEYYAADAGVEDAIWKIINAAIPAASWNSCIDRPDWDVYEYPKALSVGNKSVDVVVYRKDWDLTCGENLTYQILSTAVTDDGRDTAAITSTTAIESYVDAEIVVGSLLDNAITSQDNVTIKPGSTVNGTVQYGGTLDNKGTINGEQIPEPYGKWPTFEELSTRYWNQVSNLTASTVQTVTIPDGATESDPYVIGPLRSEPRGGTLTVEKKGYVKLGGTIYVKSNLEIKSSPAITVDLNQKTIFAEGDITVDTGNTITGSGCIIARGDIWFQPNMQASPNDFVFLLSIEGTVHFQPAHGTFYGSVAGKLDVDLWGDTQIVWRPIPEGVDINFPIEDYMYATNKVKTLAIRTWEINPQ